MSLKFPKNPNDGDEFNGFVHDGARGIWKVKFRADPFESVDIANVQAGEAIVYDGTKWVTDKVSSAEVKVVSATAPSNTVNIDFSDGVPLEKITVAGDITFTGSNYTAGVEKKILLVGDTVKRNLTFPQGWSFLNDIPAAVGADKNNILEVSCFGTTEDSVFANFDGPSSFESIVANGGSESQIIVNGVTYKVHTFTATGIFTVADLGTSGQVEYLIVGGGGGSASGGGGAGGFLEGSLSVSTGNNAVLVGAGGSSSAGTVQGASNGGNSSFSGIVAIGGGRGGGSRYGTGGNGGSGGGASYDATSVSPASGTVGQGNSGGIATFGSSGGGGGGGGASAPGKTPGVVNYGGDGGDGKPSSISGSTNYYAGGGGAGANTPNTSVAGQGGLGGGGNGATQHLGNGFAGVANTGGGAGGGDPEGAGNNGGSGIVIIRYPITDPN